MHFKPDNIYHAYNQGNNQQQIFFTDNDYITFLQLTRTLVKPHCEIIAYCLMPNHFHFMIATDDRCAEQIKQGGNLLDAITNGFRKLLSGYSRIFNKANNQTGSMFRQKTKAKCLSQDISLQSPLSVTDYYANCFYYVHLNPLKAGLVTKAEDWEYSSCKDYASCRNGTLINKTMAEKYCNYSSATFLKELYNKADINFDF